MAGPETSKGYQPFSEWIQGIIAADIQAYKETTSSGLSFQIDLNADQVSYLRAYKRGTIDWNQPAIRFSDTKKQRVLQSLIGIVSISAVFTDNGREVYTGYGIPEENQDALRNANVWPFAVDSFDNPEQEFGPFVKPLEARDVSVLRAIRERDRELYERFKHRIIPSFHPTEVAKLAEVESGVAIESVLRLTGMLGRKHIKVGHMNRSKWFIPAARRADIDAFLAQNPQ